MARDTFKVNGMHVSLVPGEEMVISEGRGFHVCGFLIAKEDVNVLKVKRTPEGKGESEYSINENGIEIFIPEDEVQGFIDDFMERDAIARRRELHLRLRGRKSRAPSFPPGPEPTVGVDFEA